MRNRIFLAGKTLNLRRKFWLELKSFLFWLIIYYYLEPTMAHHFLNDLVMDLSTSWIGTVRILNHQTFIIRSAWESSKDWNNRRQFRHQITIFKAWYWTPSSLQPEYGVLRTIQILWHNVVKGRWRNWRRYWLWETTLGQARSWIVKLLQPFDGATETTPHLSDDLLRHPSTLWIR